MGIPNLRDFMVKDARQYIIEKVKAPILKALVILAKRYPEPTRENTFHPNTHVLMDIWDKFLAMEDNTDRLSLFRAIRKIWIAECEHDIYYRDRDNVLQELWLEEVLKGNWRPRFIHHPNTDWKEDRDVRGAGYEFMKEHYKGRGGV